MALKAEVMNPKDYARSPQPGVIRRDSPANNVGSVARVTSGVPNRDLFTDTLVATMANATATPRNFVIGDPSGAIASEVGGTTYTPTWSAYTNAIVNNYFSRKPHQIVQMNIEVTTGTAAQFARSFFLYNAASGGAVVKTPLQLSKYKRNDSQNSTLLTVNLAEVGGFVFHDSSAMVISVGATTTVVITFDVVAIHGAIV